MLNLFNSIKLNVSAVHQHKGEEDEKIFIVLTIVLLNLGLLIGSSEEKTEIGSESAKTEVETRIA